MPAPLSDLIADLNDLLEPQRFRDYCPNGLQVPGKPDIARVATGVSAGAELFERALAESADLILVHHGLFWSRGQSSIDPTMKRRLKLLFDADVSLAAYHLPLDAHPQLGNNALIAKALGAEEQAPFADHEGEPIGVLAHFANHGLDAATLRARTAELTGRDPLFFAAGPASVCTMAIVSGGGCSYLGEAIEAGADAFLTGEPTERVMTQAQEASIHFIAAGHYATETFGVRALGEHLATRFGVEHVFIDVPNPV
ncbi:MAG TPA: Nif3-like dinuclear metal center hexameric protein [Solirubrobacteraceae bacterium]|nr:Nif3-like dinuclear metal center hexameric protein [Solirubrobacteraceae bacterium]